MDKFVKVAGITLLVVVIGLGVAVGVSLAQGPTPPAPAPAGDMGGPGLDLGLGGQGDWTVFDAAAKALGVTPEQLFSELHSGKTLSDVAKDKGVDIKTVTQAVNDVKQAAAKKAIEQAVTDKRITQEQADWMLQGMEKGWMGGPGFGLGFRGLGPGQPQGQSQGRPQN